MAVFKAWNKRSMSEKNRQSGVGRTHQIFVDVYFWDFEVGQASIAMKTAQGFAPFILSCCTPMNEAAVLVGRSEQGLDVGDKPGRIVLGKVANKYGNFGASRPFVSKGYRWLRAWIGVNVADFQTRKYISNFFSVLPPRPTNTNTFSLFFVVTWQHIESTNTPDGLLLTTMLSHWHKANEPNIEDASSTARNYLTTTSSMLEQGLCIICVTVSEIDSHESSACSAERAEVTSYDAGPLFSGRIQWTRCGTDRSVIHVDYASSQMSNISMTGQFYTRSWA
ncbi:hypothetical protein IW262DRAFT_1302469 [Armillaria fumosa]|nr:hypothetical protein IW262DRAFT_1302469 [Armillaria fumosa]